MQWSNAIFEDSLINLKIIVHYDSGQKYIILHFMKKKSK